MSTLRPAFLLCAFLTCAFSASLAHAAAPRPTSARDAMVVTAHPLATEAGLEMLARGGNAVDAAVAAAFALGVAEPYGSGLGGGGFALVHLAESGATLAIDFRETAPAAAGPDFYLDDNGDVISEASLKGHRAVAVPGQVAGLAFLAERYGRLSLRTLVDPALQTANVGVPVDEVMHAKLTSLRDHLAAHPETRRIFLNPDGSVPGLGSLLPQPDQAAALYWIGQYGAPAFYDGPIADALIAEMERGAGAVTRADLARYNVTVREPVSGTYRGGTVMAMPPPSSGGVHLIQMLNMLEGDDLGAMGFGSAELIHLMAEVERRAYADRAEYLGDPAFSDVPVAELTSKDYARHLRAQIDPERATPSSEVHPGLAAYSPAEGDNTTHLCVIDEDGNAVSMTSSINSSFGSGVTVPGFGILLNNTMDDFAAKPGVPNLYGLVGSEANAIAAGKIPLSSMTPTMVFGHNGELIGVMGSPGGSRIITTVLQIVVNLADHHMDVSAAVAAPRFHHQWLPDEIKMERGGFSPDTIRILEGMGHTVVQEPAWSNATAIIDDARQSHPLSGAADPRGNGTAGAAP
ncbi:MAG: gamma-glutamyltransferase [Sumerlaeia bacterium]